MGAKRSWRQLSAELPCKRMMPTLLSMDLVPVVQSYWQAGGGLRWSFGLADVLNFDARHAASIHFHHGKAEIAVVEAFAALRYESQLVEDKTSCRCIGRIFRQSDVVLCVQIANAQRSVENNRAVGKRQRPLHDIKFVVNFSNKLFENVFHRHEPQNAAELVDDDSYRSVL